MQLKKVDCFEDTRFYVFSRSSRRLSAGYCSNNKVDHCASQILRGMKPLLGITSASTSSLSVRGHFKGYCAPQLAIS